jgi:hypothetical protein
MRPGSGDGGDGDDPSYLPAEVQQHGDEDGGDETDYAAVDQTVRAGMKRRRPPIEGNGWVAASAEPFVCEHAGCGRVFKKRSKLQRHELAVHSGERPYVCEEAGCTKAFARAEHLRRHVRSAHTAERPYVCETPGCGKAFASAHHLRRHREAHDAGLRPFACSASEGCLARFAKRSALAAHEAKHLGRKACRCAEPGCAAEFDYPSQLQKHALHSHGREVEGGATFVCAEEGCMAVFRSRQLLTRHQKEAHRPQFPCPREGCSRIYERRTQLAAHIRKVHDQPAPKRMFSCPVEGCAKTYTKQSNLDTHHRNVHLKLRPHACGFVGCDQRFGYRHLLQRHQLKCPHAPAPPAPAPTREQQQQEREEEEEEEKEGEQQQDASGDRWAGFFRRPGESTMPATHHHQSSRPVPSATRPAVATVSPPAAACPLTVAEMGSSGGGGDADGAVAAQQLSHAGLQLGSPSEAAGLSWLESRHSPQSVSARS